MSSLVAELVDEILERVLVVDEGVNTASITVLLDELGIVLELVVAVVAAVAAQLAEFFFDRVLGWHQSSLGAKMSSSALSMNSMPSAADSRISLRALASVSSGRPPLM